MNKIYCRFSINKIAVFAATCFLCFLIVNSSLAAKSQQIACAKTTSESVEALSSLKAGLAKYKIEFAKIDKDVVNLAWQCIPDDCSITSEEKDELFSAKDISPDSIDEAGFRDLKTAGELALQLLSENKNDLKSLEDETLKNWNDNLLKPLCGIDLKNFDEGNSLALMDSMLGKLIVRYNQLFIGCKDVLTEALSAGAERKFEWETIIDEISSIPGSKLYPENLCFVRDMVIPMLILLTERIKSADGVNGGESSWSEVCKSYDNKLILLKEVLTVRLYGHTS